MAQGKARAVATPSEGRDHPVFRALTENAFEFLQKSVVEFEASPKFSVVHFCAALEMLLKARLMVEHWALIVGKTEGAKRADFLSGDFISVTLDQTLGRLRDVVGLNIPDTAATSFKAAAKHRNKLIHFFHPDLVQDEARAKIVLEQANAWFHLHRLLKSWPEFNRYKQQIDAAEQALREHKKYLGVRFKQLEPELARVVAQGGEVGTCRVCQFASAVVHPVQSFLSAHVCSVCDHREDFIAMTCIGCGEDICLTNYKTCEHCDHEYSNEELLDHLLDPADAYRAMKDGEDPSPANCGNCDGYHTVVACEEKYFCVDCFDLSDRADACEWCNELNTGDMEGSHYAGCNQCEGYSGHTRDD